jgi:Uma2 family endonuclease
MKMAIAKTLVPSTIDNAYYPSGDGEPMAETPFHVRAIRELADFLDDLLAGTADAWVGVDEFWYWEKGRPRSRCAPDIMVVFGVPKESNRRSFFTWREGGRVPSFICEFASQHTWREDLGEKFKLYERLGVEEYFLFDPEDLYLEAPLLAFRLRSGKYRRLRPSADGSIESRTLGVKLVAEGRSLRLLDLQTGQKIPSRLEREKEAQETVGEKDAEIARLRALLDQTRRKKNGPRNS